MTLIDELLLFYYLTGGKPILDYFRWLNSSYSSDEYPPISDLLLLRSLFFPSADSEPSMLPYSDPPFDKLLSTCFMLLL